MSRNGQKCVVGIRNECEVSKLDVITQNHVKKVADECVWGNDCV